MEAFIVYELEGGYIVSPIDDIDSVIGSPAAEQNQEGVRLALDEWLERNAD